MTGELQHQHSPWFHNTNITSCSTYNLHTIITTTTHPALAHPLLKRHPPLPHALVGALNGTLVPGRVLVIAPKIDGPPFLVLINRGKGPGGRERLSRSKALPLQHHVDMRWTQLCKERCTCPTSQSPSNPNRERTRAAPCSRMVNPFRLG